MLVTSFGVCVSFMRSPSKRNRTLPVFSYLSIVTYALSLAIGVHELLENRRLLNLEEHLLAVLSNRGSYLRLDRKVEKVWVSVSSGSVRTHRQYF